MTALQEPAQDLAAAELAAALESGSIGEQVSARLLESAAELSYDPATEVDWDAPLDPDQYGLNPEWSTLYGTSLWDEMSHEQRVALTRHEVCSIMSTGIWFEMILQQMVLRDQYVKDSTSNEFRFALTEIGDECRHSIMFARACEKMGVGSAYLPTRASIELGRGFKTLASAETAYTGILVAEEVLDVMQRDWMRGEDVLPMVRTTSRIHVVEESRHMSFARQEVRDHLRGVSPMRRRTSALIIAIAAHVIVSNMVNRKVYAAVGLDEERALEAARTNDHHHAMMRTSSRHLMAFLDECGLLTKPAVRIYSRLHMI
nr:diiron oxygenase [Jatrophihabitans endophyticus]